MFNGLSQPGSLMRLVERRNQIASRTGKEAKTLLLKQNEEELEQAVRILVKPLGS